MRIRAKITTVEELDSDLVKLQDDGFRILNIIPINGTAKADTLDAGHGRGEMEFSMGVKFILTYEE